MCLSYGTNITGCFKNNRLDNYNLYGQAKFDTNTVKMIDGFLRQLPAPVCFVSHNGDRFDFPSKAELEKCGGKLENNNGA